MNELYNKLVNREVASYGVSVNCRNGFFSENDMIKVFEGGTDIYFQIDKTGMQELTQNVIARLNEIKSENDFRKMIDLFEIIQFELKNYFGKNTCSGFERLRYYTTNGISINEYAKFCSMSSLREKGVAECAEKASVTNNLLLILKEMNVFPYEVNYINSNVEMPSEVGGHAFLEFSRMNSKGNLIHLIYDVTNPEVIIFNGNIYYYPAIYQLSDEEYKDFMENGKPFDNSHFILSETYQLKEKRVYKGFVSDTLKQGKY